MALGLDMGKVMHSTLKDLRMYDVAHERKLKEQDYLNYLAGEYVFDALMAALGNMFSDKKHESKTFAQIRKKPILSDLGEKKEEVDEQSAYEQYRVQRMIDKLNWDLAHMDVESGEVS